MYISISQIKTANASLAKRAWEKILWITQQRESDSLDLGNMFEHYLINKEDAYDRFLQNITDKEKFIATYDALKHNAIGLEVPEWDYQYKVESELFWCPFIGYIDIRQKECLYDIKTIYRTWDIDGKNVNHWSWLTYLEEYELQMRAYMKTTWIKKSKILAVWKFLYADKRNDNRVLDIDRSDELDARMTAKIWPLVEQMQTLYSKHKWT